MTVVVKWHDGSRPSWKGIAIKIYVLMNKNHGHAIEKILILHH